MTTDISALIAQNAPNTLALHREYLNPQMANVVELLGCQQDYTKAQGPYLYDAEGRQYLDLLSGFGVFAVGRNHPGIVAALRQTLETELPNLVQMSLSSLSGVLAAKLAALTPGNLDKLFFCNSGTETVEAAIKFSRCVTGRPGIIHCDHAFHGMTLGSLSIAGDEGLRAGFGPLLPGCSQIPFNDLEALERALRDRQAAAFIVEPIQGKAVVVPDDDYLPEAKKLCERYGTLFVADEVQTGLGRTGAWWAVDHWQVEPDMLLMSKALSGGFVPVGAVAMKKSIMDGVYGSIDRAGVHGSTFSKNNLAMAAGIATLDVLQGDKLIDNAAKQGAALLSGLASLKRPGGLLQDVRGKGLMIGLEFGAPASAELAECWNQFEGARPGLFGIALTCVLLQQRRILSQVSDYDSSLIKLMPTLGIGDADRHWIQDALQAALADAGRADGAVWEHGWSLLQAAASGQPGGE